MDYQAIVENRLQQAHLQLVHLHPAPHEYLFKLQQNKSLSLLSPAERNQVGQILLTFEIHSFLWSSVVLFEWDLFEVPLSERVKMKSFFGERLSVLPVEKADIANWVLEKVIPYCEQCQEQAVFSSYESFLDLLHLVDQLSFITEQINDDEEARVTWIFDWFHTLKSDVEHYKFLEHKKEYSNFDIKELPKQLLQQRTLRSRFGNVNVIKQKDLSEISFKRGEGVYGQSKEHIKMEYQKRTAPNYSIQMS